MARRLTQRSRAFYSPLAEAARVALDAATALSELLDRYPERFETAPIRSLELDADRHARSLADRIAEAFATPIEAEDLARLAVVLDDVTDAVSDVADALVLYRPRELPEQARTQGRLLVRACERIVDATVRLPQLPDLSGEQADVRALEHEGDVIAREATAALFHSGLEAMEILRLKGVLDALEAAVDACRAAADALALVALSNRW